MRRLALLATASSLVLCAGARADVRHAAPAGTGDCSQPSPCDLETAVSGAVAGDEIVVAAGVHALSATLAPTVPLTIHGGTPGPSRPFIVGPSGGAVLDAAASVALSDLTLQSVDPGPAATVLLAGDNSTADRIEVIATSATGPATALRPGNGAVVRDSLLRAYGPIGAEALFYQATAPGAVTLRNVTAVAGGPHSIAIAIYATDTAPAAAIEATNVVADAEVDLSADSVPAATSAINAYSSNFNSGIADNENGNTIGGSGNQVLPPRFVHSAAGDYRQAPGSPTIDSGLTDAGNSIADLDGNPRTANERTDIGAYETQPQPVSVPVTPARDTIAASTVIGALRLSRKGTVATKLTCPAGEARCDWSYTLRSARSLVLASKQRKRKRVLRLGAGRASGPGGRRVTVRIKLSKRNFRLIKRRKRLRVKLTVRTADAAANVSTSKRNATLRAPRPTRK